MTNYRFYGKIVIAKLILRLLTEHTGGYNEKYTDMLKKAKDFSYVTYSKGRAVRCPLCNAIILIEAVRFFGRN